MKRRSRRLVHIVAGDRLACRPRIDLLATTWERGDRATCTRCLAIWNNPFHPITDRMAAIR